MSRPTIQFQPVNHGDENWDVPLVANFALLQSVFSGPLPMGLEYANPAALPAASAYDGCVGVAQDPISGWQLVLSDGTSWHYIGRQASPHEDTTANNVPDLVAHFNGLLAKLRAAGIMASS